MTEPVEVHLWGRPIGTVLREEGAETTTFRYDAAFVAGGVEVSPFEMPLREGPCSFPALSRETFKGLPGLLYDSLPDRFGTALIDAWLKRQGRSAESADAVERLRYIGTRGMGALEYAPIAGPEPPTDEEIEVGELVEIGAGLLGGRDDESGLLKLLGVGMSAGGARPKAMIAWNEATGQVRSGQVDAPAGFEHWLLKFDGVKAGGDREGMHLTEGFGAIEMAYAEMAGAAGIEMARCRLFEENGRRHFMTRRFDRPDGGAKIHMQSLGGLRHFDFNLAGGSSYEQALLTIRELGLPMATIEQQFRRMAFNVVARNQDDHVKNVAFLMDRGGNWSLSPAFDVTYSFDPQSRWTRTHQMSLNGKRDDFTSADFVACARGASMARGRAEQILAEVTAAVSDWPRFAAAQQVPEPDAERIAGTHRLGLG